MKHGAALLVAASATLYGIIPVLTKLSTTRDSVHFLQHGGVSFL